MKKLLVPFFLFLLFVPLLLSLFAAAIKEGYVTRSLTVATNTAEVFFPQNPVKIMRLVSYDVNGDTNTAILTMYSGTMPLTITGIHGEDRGVGVAVYVVGNQAHDL